MCLSLGCSFGAPVPHAQPPASRTHSLQRHAQALQSEVGPPGGRPAGARHPAGARRTAVTTPRARERPGAHFALSCRGVRKAAAARRHGAKTSTETRRRLASAGHRTPAAAAMPPPPQPAAQRMVPSAWDGPARQPVIGSDAGGAPPAGGAGKDGKGKKEGLCRTAPRLCSPPRLLLCLDPQRCTRRLCCMLAGCAGQCGPCGPCCSADCRCKGEAPSSGRSAGPPPATQACRCACCAARARCRSAACCCRCCSHCASASGHKCARCPIPASHHSRARCTRQGRPDFSPGRNPPQSPPLRPSRPRPPWRAAALLSA